MEACGFVRNYEFQHFQVFLSARLTFEATFNQYNKRQCVNFNKTIKSAYRKKSTTRLFRFL